VGARTSPSACGRGRPRSRVQCPAREPLVACRARSYKWLTRKATLTMRDDGVCVALSIYWRCGSSDKAINPDNPLACRSSIYRAIDVNNRSINRAPTHHKQSNGQFVFKVLHGTGNFPTIIVNNNPLALRFS